jgi:hypothetical protein
LSATDFLPEARLRGAKPKSRPYKLTDGGGLYLLVTPSGAKQWRLRYTLGGRESMVSLGTYRGVVNQLWVFITIVVLVRPR